MSSWGIQHSSSPRRRSVRKYKRNSSSDCDEGQTRDKITKECREKKTRKRRADCKEGQTRDKITKKCREKKTRGKRRADCKEGQTRDKITKECREKKTRGGKRRADCKVGQTRDKITKECRDLKPCKPHQERSVTTNRCVNKKIPVKTRRKSKRKSKKKKSKKKKSKKNRPTRLSTQIDTELDKELSRQTKSIKNCINRSKLPLRNIQIQAVQYLDNHDGVLLVHGTGCGKTLTAIAASQCYLDKHPNRQVVFVGPTSLISNFKKEMKRYDVKNRKSYEFYSFAKFYIEEKRGNRIRLKKKMLIVDEAHGLRNPKSLRSRAVVRASFEADKRLLLSATPYVNSLTDFIPLINIVYGEMMVGNRPQFRAGEVRDYIGKQLTDENLRTITYLLDGKIHVVDCAGSKHFPKRKDKNMNVVMSDKYYERYSKLLDGEEIFGILFKNPSAFYNGYRRAVNKAGPNEYYSQKIVAALPKLKRGKSVIYTNWVNFGVDPISKALEENKISYGIFTGKTKVSERQQLVDAFNNNEFKTLIITKAGGEGLDLKGVKNVIVLDPPWNDASLQQVVGRAIRYKSHAHLPKKKRKVKVYFLKLVPPLSTGDKISGDTILYDIIDKKNKINIVLKALYERMSI